MEGQAECKRFKKSEDESELINPTENNNNKMSATSTSSSLEQQQNDAINLPLAEEMNQLSPKTNGTDDKCPTDPLSIANVLESTFRNLNVEQLKVLRLVNKQWESAASKELQEKLDLIVFTEEFYDADKMLKIIQIFKQSFSENPPYVKFEIASKFFTAENEDLITDFFRTFSSYMEYLKISTDKNHDSKFKFAEVLFTTVSLPRLKSLIFEDHTPNGVQAQYNHDFSLFFKAIISSAINLESLILSFPKRFFEADDGESTMAQLHAMPDGIICSKSSQNLKHLEISAKINDVQLLCLSRSGLKLRTLHFRVKNASLQESSFTALLESQSNSLLELKLTEERHGSDFLVKFPKMKVLKKITIISICEFENSIVTFAPFSYKDDLPQMESLILWNCFGKEERWRQFFMATPSPTITRLELPTQFRNPGLAQNIAVVFPALKRLKIGFSLRPENEEVMRIIFETLESLEELAILTDMDEMNENIDHILTGIPKIVCKKIRQEQSYLSPSCLNGVQRGPSLINLKNLKRLDIVLDNNRAPFITDVAGHLAFMQIPKLKILRFTRYGMSQECVDVLVKKYCVEFIPPHGRNLFEMDVINLDDLE